MIKSKLLPFNVIFHKYEIRSIRGEGFARFSSDYYTIWEFGRCFDKLKDALDFCIDHKNGILTTGHDKK